MKMSERQEGQANASEQAEDQNRRTPVRLNSLGHALSGMSASVLNTVILYPLDVVKTRFQGRVPSRSKYF